VRTNRDKIRTWLEIVIMVQSDGVSVMFGHIYLGGVLQYAPTVARAYCNMPLLLQGHIVICPYDFVATLTLSNNTAGKVPIVAG